MKKIQFNDFCHLISLNCNFTTSLICFLSIKLDKNQPLSLSWIHLHHYCQVLFSTATLSFVSVISVIQFSYVVILILIHCDFQLTGSGWANTVASNQATNGAKLRNGFAMLIKLEVTYKFKFLFNLASKLKKYIILCLYSHTSTFTLYGFGI